MYGKLGELIHFACTKGKVEGATKVDLILKDRILRH